jgi:hypothetical protein
VRARPVAAARFWGKVLGGDRDYYVAECEYSEGARPRAGREEEDRGGRPRRAPPEEDSGPNALCYFVCTARGAGWAPLPDVTPQQIAASRCIRHRFTGRLDAPVIAPPGRFDGAERELLRAVIARITHACTVAVAGMYRPEEEPEEDAPLAGNAPIALNEDWAPRPMRALDAFVHRLPALLPQGRTECWAPEEEERDERAPGRVERGPPILRSLAQDEPLPRDLPSWSLRVVPVVAPVSWAQPSIPGVTLPAEGRRAEAQLKTERSHVIWLRSNAWPGLSVVVGETTGRIVMHYYGWGMKGTEPEEWPEIPEPPKKILPRTEEEEEEEKKEPEKKKGDEEEDEGDSDAPKKRPAAKPKPPDDSETDESGTYEGSTYDGSTT